MNKLLPTGCALSASIAALFLCDPEMLLAGYTVGALAAIQTLGLVMIAAGLRRPGAVVALIGSLPMIPAGLVTALGARQELDRLAEEEFEAATP